MTLVEWFALMLVAYAVLAVATIAVFRRLCPPASRRPVLPCSDCGQETGTVNFVGGQAFCASCKDELDRYESGDEDRQG